METLIVLSHLRWNFVYQRPQQVLSRIARSRPVVFFEEPVYTPGKAFMHTYSPVPDVTVCVPHTPLHTPGFDDVQLTHLKPLLMQLIGETVNHDYVVWLYTPMALPLLQYLTPRALVYDCMDELSGFLNAPQQLLQRESMLLKTADLVFTGGPSLHDAKKNRTENAYCFPSSVDAAHFATARDGDHEAPETRGLRRPRLGFYGVIDERLDLQLLDAIATRRPNWEIVLVGPVVKIAAESLPQRANIHYYGQQDYQRLPEFLAGWDIGILPFALNASTRFISPTKTLEYMAAERMIVSTPITDVAKPYGDIVFIGDGPDEFIDACERALQLDDRQREARVLAMRAVLARTSWDVTATQMEALIQSGLRSRSLRLPRDTPRAKPDAEVGTGNASLMTLARKPPEQSVKVTDIIIGAGPTGLSAAYHLGADCRLVERNESVGGWCRSIVDQGFTFDHAGHIMFSNDAYVHEMYAMLLGDNVHWQDREAWVHSHDVFTRYPFQGALYGLPPKVIEECIMGAVEARFGQAGGKPGARATSNPASTPDDITRLRPVAATLVQNVTRIRDCCADGIAEATVSATRGAVVPPDNFEDFIYQVWGAGIARHFAIPYNQKLWAVPLTEMETSWLGGRVPQPDLAEIIEGALQPAPKPVGPNARFGYPLHGGFQALMDGFLPHVHDQLTLNTGVHRISTRRRTVTLDDGEVLRYRTLVSTMPLPALIAAMQDEVPDAVRRAADGLRNVSVRCVNLGIARPNLTDKHWIYYPGDTVFHRIFVQSNASPHCHPEGAFGFTCEITYSPHKPLPCDGNALIQRCIDDCIRVGMITEADRILVANQVDMPYAYVVYDHQRKHNVEVIRQWLDSHDILLAGRYSEWEYYNSDHAFLAGKKVAEAVQLRALDKLAHAARVQQILASEVQAMPVTAS